MGVRRRLASFQSPGSKELCWPQFMQAASYTLVREAQWAQLDWHSGLWVLQMLMAPVFPHPRHTSTDRPGSCCDPGLSCGTRGKSRLKGGSRIF